MKESLRQECRDVLMDYAGVELSDDQLTDLLRDDPDVEKMINEYESPRDTMDRELLIDLLAKRLTGRAWPCYGEGREVFNQFIDKFNDAAGRAGYTVVR